MFLDYGPLIGIDDTLKGSIMRFVRLDVLVATVLAYLEQVENRGGYRQRIYADILKRHVSEVVSQLIGQICSFVQFWGLNS